MNAWSNIPISSRDREIIKINEFEAKLGKLSASVYKIRELITRHEVCHFKYQVHIEKIKHSIIHLQPALDPDKIGINHIQHGENAWEKDSTGKSLLGQQYVWAIKYWLDEFHYREIPDKYDKRLGQKVQNCLGEKDIEKRRLVQYLLARLTWDWKSYEELQHGGEYKDLEYQIGRMDICHFAFPLNLERLLRGIGEMRSIDNLEGCGSFNNAIREFVEKELHTLFDLFKSLYYDHKHDENSQIKAWLTVCLMKTLKEQVALSEPLIEF